MGLPHHIAEGFQLVAASLQTPNPPEGVLGVPILPGGLYYGARGEADSPVYPLGLLAIEETDRELNSGGGSLARYEVRLTVYAQAGQDYPAEIVRRFQAYLTVNNLAWDAIPAALGIVVSIIPQAGTMEEDPDDEFGQDTDRASITWQFTLSERAKL